MESSTLSSKPDFALNQAGLPSPITASGINKAIQNKQIASLMSSSKRRFTVLRHSKFSNELYKLLHK